VENVMVYSSQPESGLAKKVTIQTLKNLKQQREKFVTVALYDAPMAAMAERCGIEVVLVGDSLGMTVLGYDSTIPVTMEQMIYHIEAVARGNRRSLIISDLPFMTYATPEQAMVNATRVMQAGAQMVKIEGGRWLAPIVTMLSERGIPVCAHIGLTPQSVYKLGGFRVQGRTPESAAILREDALILEGAGADIVLLEGVPAELASQITTSLHVPSIGIGAGRDTDAQVLVINDILGLTERPPKFAKNFLKETGEIQGALQRYTQEVKAGLFPADEHIFT
jgi:3-methyl-2-oxobutanoate hydroxymethyltransferase